MKNKLFICLLLVTAMVCGAMVGLTPNNIQAASQSSTQLFNRVDGAVTIESSYVAEDANDATKPYGAKFTLGKASEESSLRFSKKLSTQDLSVNFKFSAANVETFWVKLSDTNNSTKFVKIAFSIKDEKVNITLTNNVDKVQDVTVTKLTTLEGNELLVKYNSVDGSFVVGETKLVNANVGKVEFFNSEATMVFGVTGQNKEKESVLFVQSIGNSVGVQKLTNEAENLPAVVTSFNGFENGDLKATYAMNSGAGKSFTYPIYSLDIFRDGNGDALYTMSKKGAGKFGDQSSSTTSKTLTGIANEQYTIVLSNGEIKLDDKGEVKEATDKRVQIITLTVTLKEDTTAPKFAGTAGSVLINAVKAKFNKDGNNLIEAPAIDNTISFPKWEEGNSVIDVDPDGIDQYYNVRLQVGYRKVSATATDWTWASGTDVSINGMGLYHFTYKVTDAAGNSTMLKDNNGDLIIFDYTVVDNTAPKITISKKIDITINEKYTVSNGTLSDNASGVDASKSYFEVFFVDENGVIADKPMIGKDTTDKFFTPDKLTETKNSKTGNYYLVRYYATDNAGNVAEMVESRLNVVEKKADPTPNPANDAIRVVLIVLACLSGLGIIVILFIKPTPKKPGSKKAVVAKNTDVEPKADDTTKVDETAKVEEKPVDSADDNKQNK